MLPLDVTRLDVEEEVVGGCRKEFELWNREVEEVEGMIWADESQEMIEAHGRIGEELLQETQECLAFVQKNGGVGELRWVHLVPVQFIMLQFW